MCLECKRAAKMRWDSVNQEHVRNYGREYRQKVPKEVLAAKKREYVRMNKEKVKEWKKADYDRRKEVIAKKVQTWRKQNKERYNVDNRKRLKKYRDEMRDWYIKDVLKCRGYTKDIINNYPLLMEIQRIGIIEKRIKYQINKNKKANGKHKNKH